MKLCCTVLACYSVIFNYTELQILKQIIFQLDSWHLENWASPTVWKLQRLKEGEDEKIKNEMKLYCQGKVRKVESSLPLNLGWSNFGGKCPQKLKFGIASFFR